MQADLQCTCYRFRLHQSQSHKVCRLDQGCNCHSSCRATYWGFYVIIRVFTDCTNLTPACSNSFIINAFKQILTLDTSGPWSQHRVLMLHLHLKCASVHAVDSRGRASIRRHFSRHVRAVTPGSARWMSNPRLTLPLWILSLKETRPECKRPLPFSALHSFFFLLMVPWCEGFW